MAWQEDKDRVDELCKIEDGLSDYEIEFVENVSRQVVDQRKLMTDRQRALADRILTERG